MGANAFTFREGYNGTIEERMAAKIIRKGENDCWIWIGSRDTSGYGIIKIKGRNCPAHRVAYELAYGPIPPKLIVLHTCDNPACVNPDHLIIGTYKDNMQDMLRKGRENKPKGEKHYRAKLSRAKINEARNLRIKEHLTFTELGRMYGVYRTTIARAIKGLNWKSGDVNGP